MHLINTQVLLSLGRLLSPCVGYLITVDAIIGYGYDAVERQVLCS